MKDEEIEEMRVRLREGHSRHIFKLKVKMWGCLILGVSCILAITMWAS
jgi:hypothetical protein